MAKGMFALVELDDVVADSRHRASVDIEKDRIDMMAGDELIYPTSRMLKGFYRSGIEIVLVTTKRLLKEERKSPERGFPLTASPTTIWFRSRAWSI